MVFIPALFPAEIHGITLRELGNEIAKLSEDEEMLLEDVIASEVLIAARGEEIDALNAELDNFNEELAKLGIQKKELVLSIEESKKKAF